MPGRDQALQRIKDRASEHADDCSCQTCRAAAGDETAKRKLLRELT